MRQSGKSKPQILSITLLFVLGVLLPPSINGQERVFGPVDKSSRKRLSERLAQFVEYEKSQNWAAVYDMLTAEGTNGQSRQEFIRRQSRYTKDGEALILNFTPQYTVKSRVGMENQYDIEGCAKMRWKGRSRQWQAGITAELKGKEWFFSSKILTIFAAIDGPPARCN